MRLTIASILFAVKAYTLLQQFPIVVAEDVGTSSEAVIVSTAACDESSISTVLACPETGSLTIEYETPLDCGDVLTLEQAAAAPTLRADASVINPDDLYTLVLVDTTTNNTFFTVERSNLQYGAANIPGFFLIQGLSLDRTNTNQPIYVFSEYRGPNPAGPNTVGMNSGIADTLFAYEFMLAVQPGQIEIPEQWNDRNEYFEYKDFFQETVGVELNSLTASTYFLSGRCVALEESPTTAPTTMSPTTEPPELIKNPVTSTTTTTSAVEAQVDLENSSNEASESNNGETSPNDPSSSDNKIGEDQQMSVAGITITVLAVFAVGVSAWLFTRRDRNST